MLDNVCPELQPSSSQQDWKPHRTEDWWACNHHFRSWYRNHLPENRDRRAQVRSFILSTEIGKWYFTIMVSFTNNSHVCLDHCCLVERDKDLPLPSKHFYNTHISIHYCLNMNFWKNRESNLVWLYIIWACTNVSEHILNL